MPPISKDKVLPCPQCKGEGGFSNSCNLCWDDTKVTVEVYKQYMLNWVKPDMLDDIAKHSGYKDYSAYKRAIIKDMGNDKLLHIIETTIDATIAKVCERVKA